MDKVKKQRGVRGIATVSSLPSVTSYIAFMPYYRRFKRLYRLSDASISTLYCIAYSGAITPTRLSIFMHGVDDGTTLRGLHARLVTLKGKGLVVSIGGKWQLTDLGVNATMGEGDEGVQ